MSGAVQKIKSREQIITARRIAFRGNFKYNEAQSNKNMLLYPIQEVRSINQHNTETKIHNPKEWSRCKVFESSSTSDKNFTQVRDFQAYQDGNLCMFLDDSTTTKCVSDVCLVNDHFIFVKIPQDMKQSTSSEVDCLTKQMQSMSVFETSKSLFVKKDHDNKQCMISQYVDNVIACEPINNKIKKLQLSATLKDMQWRSSEENESLSLNDPRGKLSNSTLNLKESDKMVKPYEKSFPTSVHETVEIQQQSALVYMDEDSKSNRDVNWQKKRTSFGPLHWLLKPLCSRLNLRNRFKSKTKSKIQAVVYKTYFVRWSKPPDTKCHNSSDNTFHTRRIHSALV